MFQSYIENNRNILTREGCYTIIDDNFTETPETHIGSICLAAIKVYERRRLDVAPNLFRALRYHTNLLTNNWFGNLRSVINYCNREYPEYRKYANEIEKYIVLL